ncbi:methicillin resistance protein [Fimbriimonas ginsengisoli Gsoil 348]|uniref:Methicillin resistance protein n=2 Tax=Fimbriimonas ginsengisoli TaxID=1005039 RepID=A0A068NRU6_FIMGI|nr:methicillin resistance protein [Fimbriimonas ginsengisoli Gsoil 348]
MELLNFISGKGGATVGEAAAFLHETKGHSRTTAQSVMERLRKKGYLRREKIEGVFRYIPSRSGPTVVGELLDDFVARVLGGSVDPLVTYLTEKVDLDDQQLSQLRKLVRELEEKDAGR